ncbi:MAG: tetratricopeptide repeat protein [Oscillochloris sp.]|nr:tetratricopeptide repeat protein [Oscillochloris sp.]
MSMISLELSIRKAGDIYTADIQLHQTQTILTSSSNQFFARDVPLAIDTAALLSETLSPTTYGITLSAQLFANQQLREAWIKARTHLASNSFQLRLHLAPTAAELHVLRWETLHDPEDKQPLALYEHIRLVRTLDNADITTTTLPPRPDLQALVVVANPTNLAHFQLAEIDVASEIDRARAALADIPTTILGNHRDAVGRATRANLAAQLRTPPHPHLVILIAHGTQPTPQHRLLLEHEDGGADPIPNEEFITNIKRLNVPRPLLFVLASCHSASAGDHATLSALGPGLARIGIPAVLGFHGTVAIATVSLFLPRLIHELRHDGHIDRALAVARTALSQTTTSWWQAVLWLHTDGRLWREQPADPDPPTHGSLHQLRNPVADFVGRAANVDQLLYTLTHSQAVAISGVAGMGGIGKTELALKVSQLLLPHYPDAQIVIHFQGTRKPALSAAEALRQVIRAFQPQIATMPTDLTALMDHYRSLLDGKRVLILADDVLDAAQVVPLLPPSGSALLITSRQRFHVPGMQRIDLEQLDEAEAITLLRRICGRLSEPEAQRIATACGRLPMALRVAGGILLNDDTIRVADYLARLSITQRNLAALRDPDDPNLDVAASLALSYDLLSPEAQRDLCTLGVFAASFDRAAAQAVLGTISQEDLATRMGVLYRRNLLEFVPQHERYDLHELVRAFALSRQEATETAAHLRYARHYIQIAEHAHRLYRTGGAAITHGLLRFDHERANLDAARSWLQAHPGHPDCDRYLIADADATAELGELRYTQYERIPQLNAALAAAQRLGASSAQARVLGSLGNSYATVGDNQRASLFYIQALKIAQAHGNRQIESITLGNLGVTYRNLGDIDRASSCYRRQLDLARAIHDQRSEASALGNLGIIYADQNKIEGAITLYVAQLELVRALGDQRSEASALGNLGRAYTYLGKGDHARHYYQQRLAIVTALGDRHGIADSNWNLGIMFEQQGAFSDAIRHLEAGWTFYHDLGHPHAEAMKQVVMRVYHKMKPS